jgi:DNA-binding response OmpR family regulator
VENYKESRLNPDFCDQLTDEVNQLILQRESINLVSFPGTGTTIFLKFFMTHSPHKFIYLDEDKFENDTAEEFYKQVLESLKLDTKIQNHQTQVKLYIQKILPESDRLIFVFNHIDSLGKKINKDLFKTLEKIRALDKEKIVFILNSKTPLTELLSTDMMMLNMKLFTNILYLKPYGEKDLLEICKKLLNQNTNINQLRDVYTMSGGNYFLSYLLLRPDINRFNDPFINIHLKKIIESLTYQRRKVLNNIAMEKTITGMDPYLINCGLVSYQDGNYKLFSPLLKSYLKQNSSIKLSHYEEKVFKVLKDKLGKFITKDELFNSVWGEDAFPSDWALNSVIYRIRKNKAFNQQGYSIENHKKVGYRLLRD